MKKIPLGHNKFSIVDNKDFKLLNKYKWMTDNRGYAMTWEYIPKYQNNRFTAMHQIILHYNKNLRCDHKNGNKLDNRRKNLRICTHSQNLQNRKKNINNTSGYKGVDFCKNMKLYRTRICVNSKNIHIGYFENKKDAAKAYNQAAIKLHKEFAYLNKI